jgi:hypothetical protein
MWNPCAWLCPRVVRAVRQQLPDRVGAHVLGPIVAALVFIAGTAGLSAWLGSHVGRGVAL